MDTSSNITTAGTTRPITLSLSNLRCAVDTQTIERIFRQEPGVVKVYANAASEKIYIEYEMALTNPERLRAMLQDAGFVQKPLQVSCGRCQ